MSGVSANVTVLRPAAGSTVSEATPILERTRYRSGTTTVIRNTALRAGSRRLPTPHVNGDRAGKLPAVRLDSQQQLITLRHDRHGQAPVNERRHGGSPGLLLDVLDQRAVGALARESFGWCRVAQVGLQPEGLLDLWPGLVAQLPHLVQEAVGQTDLEAFRFDPVVQDRQQVRDRVVEPVGGCREAEGPLSLRFLARLLDEVPYVLLQQADHVSSQAQGGPPQSFA